MLGFTAEMSLSAWPQRHDATMGTHRVGEAATRPVLGDRDVTGAPGFARRSHRLRGARQTVAPGAAPRWWERVGGSGEVTRAGDLQGGQHV